MMSGSWLDDRPADRPVLVGMSNGPAARRYVDAHPDGLDYIEFSFEQLRAAPVALDAYGDLPAILHCASLSLGGTVAPDAETLAAVAHWVGRSRTPWLGEHLAFLTAAGLDDETVVVDVGFTIGPQLGEGSLERMVRAVTRARELLDVPILVENPPVYFSLPGSTMSQTDFLCALDAQTPDGLLLDLAHLVITAANGGDDPAALLERLPLERVREIHLSGLRRQRGIHWDDHGCLPPDLEYELLARLLRRGRPTAVTLELNWPGAFSPEALTPHVERLREMLS